MDDDIVGKLLRQDHALRRIYRTAAQAIKPGQITLNENRYLSALVQIRSAVIDVSPEAGSYKDKALSLQSRPKVVCICGSSRFKTEIEQAILKLSLQGKIVLSLCCFAHADGIQLSPEEKTCVDELHFRKIDMADEVYVVCPGGYIGESTTKEVCYAKQIGRPVTYLRDGLVHRRQDHEDCGDTIQVGY